MALHASPFQLFYFLVEWFIGQVIRLFQGPSKRTEESVDGKVVVITGANSGLGKYAAEELAKRGATIVMAIRNVDNGHIAMDEIKKNSGSNKVEIVSLDLSDLSSIRECAGILKKKYATIDILINNAGISLNCPDLKKTTDGFEMHMGTNHLGHFLFTNLLLDNIKNSTAGRIITVSSTTSVMSNIDLNDLMMEKASLGLGNTMPYNNSKFANSLFNKALGKRLQGSRVKSYAVCPGLALSNIFQHYSTAGKIFVGIGLKMIGLPVNQAADIILYCALAKEVENGSGKMYRFGKQFTSVDSLYKDELADKLWDISEKLVGLKQ